MLAPSSNPWFSKKIIGLRQIHLCCGHDNHWAKNRPIPHQPPGPYLNCGHCWVDCPTLPQHSRSVFTVPPPQESLSDFLDLTAEGQCCPVQKLKMQCCPVYGR